VSIKPFFEELPQLWSYGFLNIGRFVVYYQRFSDSIMGSDWIILVGMDRQSAFAPIRNMAYIFGGSALGGAAVIVLISLLVSRRTLAPITRISEAAKYIMETGDYSIRVPVSGEDEIALLSDSFNRMLEEIQRVLRRISQPSQKLPRIRQKLRDKSWGLLRGGDQERAYRLSYLCHRGNNAGT